MAKKETKLIIDDEFKDYIPSLTDDEFKTLEKSIIYEGCRDPLVIWDNIILDGHNRYNICMKHGILFKRVEKNFNNREQAKIWILNNQLGRRNLNDAQRIDVVDRLFGLKEQMDAKERLEKHRKIHDHSGKFSTMDKEDKGKTRDKLGSKAKVSGRTYQKGKQIKTKNPEIWKQCLQGELSIDKAYKETKKQEKQQIRKEKSKQGENIEITDNEIDFRHGDFIEVFDDIPDNSIDLILTDPPYPIDFIEEWHKLAIFADKKLKKHGFLIAYCGHKNLYESMKRLESTLDFYWILTLLHEGNTKLIGFNNIEAGYKPILIYQKGFKKISNRFKDVIKGSGRSKENHDWEQSNNELLPFIQNFSKPGDTILDPFAGSGTTLIIAKKNNRYAVGCEIDKTTFNLAKKRINDEL